MNHGIHTGWQLLRESILVFNRHPRFLIPLLLTWLLYAPTILYLEYWLDWDAFNTSEVFLLVFAVIFFFAFLLAFSCSMLLELIQQLESGQKLHLRKAFEDSITQNVLTILPLVFVWAVIWFILTVIQALLSKKKDRNKADFSAENAVRTLAGYQSFSLSRAFFNAMQKGIRMIVFLILPAIAWENKSFIHASKKGIAVFRAHLSTFITGFTLTEAAAVIIFLPPAVLMYVSSELEIQLPTVVWIITIIYTSFAWSYSLYLEQMFSAELYLWNLRWEQAVALAQQEGRQIPTLLEVPKPTVLNEINDLTFVDAEGLEPPTPAM